MMRGERPAHASPSSSAERFGFVAALWRTRFFLLPQLRHFLLFAALSGVAMLLEIGAALVGFDLLTNKVFLAEPLTSTQANLLGLPAAEFVAVEELGTDARLTLRTVFLVLVGALLAVGVALGGGLGYYLTWILQRVNQQLRLAMMDAAVRLSLRRRDAEVGDAIYRVYQDSAMVTGVVRNALIAPITALFELLAAASVVAFFSPRLGLLFLIAAAPALLLVWAFTPRLRALSAKSRNANSELTSHIQESVGGARLLKACRAEDTRPSTASTHEVRDRPRPRLRAAPRRGLARHAGLLLRGAGGACRGLRHGALGVGRVADLRLRAGGVHRLRGLESRRLPGRPGALRHDLRHGRVAGDHLVHPAGHERGLEARLLPARRAAGGGRQARRAGRCRRSARGCASTAYGSASTRTSRCSKKRASTARPGAVVAIVGPSGAGKSTLLSLLLRLYDVDAGGVSIGGVDIRDIRLRELRSAIAIVLQENALFPVSVADNVRYAAPEASDATVREALRVACADEFVDALPQGIETLLGERGAKLSSGQRQRLSIARAVAKDAPILILDEPTAALDVATEQRVFERLAAHGRERGAQKVTFVVTHRLGTIRRADQILFLDHGRIVERGRHDELMAIADGHYARYVRSEMDMAS